MGPAAMAITDLLIKSPCFASQSGLFNEALTCWSALDRSILFFISNKNRRESDVVD